MLWYVAAFNLGGHRRKQISPVRFIAAHTMTPSAFCTVGTVYLPTNLLADASFQHLYTAN